MRKISRVSLDIGFWFFLVSSFFLAATAAESINEGESEDLCLTSELFHKILFSAAQDGVVPAGNTYGMNFEKRLEEFLNIHRGKQFNEILNAGILACQAGKLKPPGYTLKK